MTRHPWPFRSPLATTAPVDLDDDPEDEDSPYCRCDNLPTLGEVDRNKCAACGKNLK